MKTKNKKKLKGYMKSITLTLQNNIKDILDYITEFY